MRARINAVPRYAAIDIGSNSIRMEAAEVVPGLGTRILASDREVTRLGESVFRTGAVSEEDERCHRQGTGPRIDSSQLRPSKGLGASANCSPKARLKPSSPNARILRARARSSKWNRSWSEI